MILSWPGVIPRGQIPGPIGNHVDLLPTICKAAGVPIPVNRTFDGFDALSVAVSGAPSNHDAIFWSSRGQLAVRKGNRKLVQNGKIFDGTPQGDRPRKAMTPCFFQMWTTTPANAKTCAIKIQQR